MANESSIKNILESSLDQIRTIVDANTVLGTPINTPSGTVIIPISKLSIGFASGGLDLPAKTTSGSKNFGGGGGTGVTLSPLAILTVYPDGKVDMLPMSNAQGKAGPIEQVAELLDNTPNIIARIKEVITGFSSDKKNDAEDVAAAEAEIERKIEEEIAEATAEK